MLSKEKSNSNRSTLKRVVVVAESLKERPQISEVKGMSTPPNGETLRFVAKGLASQEHGLVLRKSMKTFLAEFDYPMTDGVREECQRVLEGALNTAFLIGTGKAKAKPASSKP